MFWTTASLSSLMPGMKEEMQGRGSGRVRDFALYGETTGETDEFGLPVRMQLGGGVSGHRRWSSMATRPFRIPNGSITPSDIDTGCVFGGRLTALRYPEREFVSVPAKQTYWRVVAPISAGRAGGSAALGPTAAR